MIMSGPFFLARGIMFFNIQNASRRNYVTSTYVKVMIIHEQFFFFVLNLAGSQTIELLEGELTLELLVCEPTVGRLMFDDISNIISVCV